MVDKNGIIEILKKNPSGLKAKEIATHIHGADRKSINQILYSNPSLFSRNDNYEWTLKQREDQATYKSVPVVECNAPASRFSTCLQTTTEKDTQDREKLYKELCSMPPIRWAPGEGYYHSDYDYRIRKGEFDRYSLSDLRSVVEDEKKLRLVQSMPEEYRKYYGFDRKKREAMSLKEIEQQLEEYRTYVNVLWDEISAKAVQLLEVTKPTFEGYCRSVKEKERQAKLAARRKEKQAALNRFYSLQAGERICEKCDKVFQGTAPLCPECQRYVGLDAELKKLELKISSFWKNLGVMGGSLMPVGLSDNRANKYEKYTRGPNYQSVLDRLNTFSEMLEDEEDELDIFSFSDYEPSELDVVRAIEKHYRNESNQLIKGKTQQQIISDRDLFTKIVVSLFLAGQTDVCKQYVQQYCLRLCDDTQS